MSEKRMPYDYVTPEAERRIPAKDPISETITISVAEYHFLTKAATLLEAVIQAEIFQRDAVVSVADRIMWGMQGAGAAE